MGTKLNMYNSMDKTKEAIEQLLKNAINSLKQQGIIDADIDCPIVVSRSKNSEFSDYSCNIALLVSYNV